VVGVDFSEAVTANSARTHADATRFARGNLRTKIRDLGIRIDRALARQRRARTNRKRRRNGGGNIGADFAKMD